MTKTFKVVAKEIKDKTTDYITAGVEYLAFNIQKGKHNIYFNIVDNDGSELLCKLKSCPHVGADWTIITEPAKYRDHVEVGSEQSKEKHRPRKGKAV